MIFNFLHAGVTDGWPCPYHIQSIISNKTKESNNDYLKKATTKCLINST